MPCIAYGVRLVHLQKHKVEECSTAARFLELDEDGEATTWILDFGGSGISRSALLLLALDLKSSQLFDPKAAACSLPSSLNLYSKNLVTVHSAVRYERFIFGTSGYFP